MWSSSRKTRRNAPASPRRLKVETLEAREQPGSVIDWFLFAPNGMLTALPGGELASRPSEDRSPAKTIGALDNEPTPLTSQTTSPVDRDRISKADDSRASDSFANRIEMADLTSINTVTNVRLTFGLARIGIATQTTPTHSASASLQGSPSGHGTSALTPATELVHLASPSPSDIVFVSGETAGFGPSDSQSGDSRAERELASWTDADLAAASQGILIQLKPGYDGARRAEMRGLIGGTLKEDILTDAMRAEGRGSLEVVELPKGASIHKALATLRNSPGVEFAEPNWILTHQDTSNDKYYTSGKLWGMYGDATSPANQYGSQAGEAWAANNTGSDSVYVGVIDEGIDFSHPDLAANMWLNPFDAANGIDDDGNGYVDDIRGWDFANNNNSIYDGNKFTTTDSHGTHVAGTIGATGGNRTGVVGVNWNVTMISAKFLNPGGGTIVNAIKAVDYFTDLKIRHGLNIVATNNSWGGGGFSQAMLDAINRAAAEDILFVAAAGNSARDTDGAPAYPASYDAANIISVAAIDSGGNLASFSNYGATTVDLAAPGVGVYSTVPNKEYGTKNGTSMASPHVAGAAALYASTHPGATAADIKAAILGSVVPTASVEGKTATGGRLNVSGF